MLYRIPSPHSTSLQLQLAFNDSLISIIFNFESRPSTLDPVFTGSLFSYTSLLFNYDLTQRFISTIFDPVSGRLSNLFLSIF